MALRRPGSRRRTSGSRAWFARWCPHYTDRSRHSPTATGQSTRPPNWHRATSIRPALRRAGPANRPWRRGLRRITNLKSEISNHKSEARQTVITSASKPSAKRRAGPGLVPPWSPPRHVARRQSPMTVMERRQLGKGQADSCQPRPAARLDLEEACGYLREIRDRRLYRECHKTTRASAAQVRLPAGPRRPIRSTSRPWRRLCRQSATSRA